MKTWSGGASGAWTGAGNWSPANAPGPGDDLRLDGTAAYTVSLGAAVGEVDAASYLLLDDPAAAIRSGANDPTLAIDDFRLLNGELDLASGTLSGSFALSGGTTDISGRVVLAPHSTLRLAGDGLSGLRFDGAGRLVLSAGSTLSVAGTLGTAQLAGLLARIDDQGGTIGPVPVLDNTGAVIDLTAAAAWNRVSLGTLSGGSVRAGDGVFGGLSAIQGDVTWIGACDIGSMTVALRGSLGFTTGGTIPALSVETGGQLLVDVGGAATADNLAIILSAGAVLAADADLTLASGCAVRVAGAARLIGLAGLSRFTNAGNLAVSALLDVGAQSGAAVFGNTGTITVRTGGELHIGAVTADATGDACNATVGFANTGTVTLAGGTLHLAAPTAIGGVIQFKAGALRVDGQGTLSATLSGFGAGSAINLTGLGYAATDTVTLAGNLLTVSGDGVIARLTLTGGPSGGYGADQFTLVSDGAGGSVLRSTATGTVAAAGPSTATSPSGTGRNGIFASSTAAAGPTGSGTGSTFQPGSGDAGTTGAVTVGMGGTSSSSGDVVVGVNGAGVQGTGTGQADLTAARAHGKYHIQQNADGSFTVQGNIGELDRQVVLPSGGTIAFSDGTGLLDASGHAELTAHVYGAAFDRAPDRAGLQYWAGQLDTGAATPVSMAETFAGSDEFRTRYGVLSDRDFVGRLYANVLGRPADNAGLDYWTGRIAGGESRGGVLLGFAQSYENLVRTLGTTGDPQLGEAYRLYQAALGHAPDPAGLGYWTGVMQAGTSPAQVAQGFLDAPEFSARNAGLDATGFVSGLYANVLGRAPDAAGVQYWTTQIGNGTSRAAVLAGFADSPENRFATGAATHDGWVYIPS